MTNNNTNSSINATKEKVYIASTSVALPPYSVNQSQAEAFLVKYYSNKLSKRSLAILHKVFAHPGVSRRHLAIENIECLISEDPDSRIARFTQWAVDLSARAIVNALSQAGLTVNEVSGLVVNTCTGYICPGISTYLIERLGFSERIRAHDLVGSGCGGAIPNLQMSKDIVNGQGDGVVVSVSVEICSATFQMADDMSLIISNAIFADGAAASVLRHRPEGLELVASANQYNPKNRDDIRYVYKNGQLHNQLSTSLPEIASKTVAMVVTDLLKSNGLQIEDIRHWAFHPGGEKVINAVRDELGLREEQMQVTRNILARYGNMSSPTVFFVIHEILKKGVAPGDWCVMAAFGAGLCAHAFLLRT
ncbi:MAG: type III polyketide synthase [Planctomycetes bacterium]|nr:type III polyketide synthase [Planctomycetota bacterium]